MEIAFNVIILTKTLNSLSIIIEPFRPLKIETSFACLPPNMGGAGGAAVDEI